MRWKIDQDKKIRKNTCITTIAKKYEVSKFRYYIINVCRYLSNGVLSDLISFTQVLHICEFSFKAKHNAIQLTSFTLLISYQYISSLLQKNCISAKPYFPSNSFSKNDNVSLVKEVFRGFVDILSKYEQQFRKKAVTKQIQGFFMSINCQTSQRNSYCV